MTRSLTNRVHELLRRSAGRATLGLLACLLAGGCARAITSPGATQSGGQVRSAHAAKLAGAEHPASFYNSYPRDFQVTPVPATVKPPVSRDTIIAEQNLAAGEALAAVELAYVSAPSFGNPDGTSQATRAEWVVTITGARMGVYGPNLASPHPLPGEVSGTVPSTDFRFYNADTGVLDMGENVEGAS